MKSVFLLENYTLLWYNALIMRKYCLFDYQKAVLFVITKPQSKIKERLLASLTVFGFFIGFLGFFSGLWYCDAYGDVGFDSILFTLTNGIRGVGRELTTWYIFAAAIPTVLCTAGASLLLLIFWKKERIYHIGKFRFHLNPLRRPVAALMSLVMAFSMLMVAADITGLSTHVSAKMTVGTLYEEHYVNPEETTVKFPAQKRNLVYIFLESMENTYQSVFNGGALSHDLIPELAELAAENVSFSHNERLGGFHSTVGTTWTTGALVGSTAGIHLQVPVEIDLEEYAEYYDAFLPGAYTLTDMLHDNGYRQMFMCGSDASFGGRREYFTQHGVDEIFDLNTARETGLIAEDYFQWWGFEDAKLMEYAKTQMTELSRQQEPFAFFMLTCDTHFVDGYICPDCPRDEEGNLLYEESYDNAIACSSRRVYEFVRWLQAQPFAANTTIVISGDHRTMDNNFIDKYVEEDFVRTQYNCIINGAVKPTNTLNRQFAPFDLYPTTLAALGCRIEGDRLALGTNLFSDEPTLMERLGSLEKLNQELSYHSEYYENYIASDFHLEKVR